MWPTRQRRFDELNSALKMFSKDCHVLLGVSDDLSRETLAMQMVASLRRLDYTRVLKGRDVNEDRANPQSALFDPERAAILHARAGRTDEAIWLIFWPPILDSIASMAGGC